MEFTPTKPALLDPSQYPSYQAQPGVSYGSRKAKNQNFYVKYSDVAMLAQN